MTAPSSRRLLLRDIPGRFTHVNGEAAAPDPVPTSEYFGVNAFGARQMRDKLPKQAYNKLKEAILLGKKLDIEIAPIVARVIRQWAQSHGVTHFTHWFQPQTGLTAEKHDAFLTFDEDKQPMEAFTGAQLVQSEPDASSFPSGGLRATWEARGYTAWNPASPVFIVETAGTRTLYIPSVYVGYNGEALDEMTPLLRSSDALSNKARKLLELLGDEGVYRVTTTLGVEQEYFLIDRGYFAMRPDLVMARRTLIGAEPSRGQQLEDHYFAGIPERVQGCMAEVERELYKLGVPIVTRHNEVAPSQYEMAPMYEDTDVAVDHNQLVMATLRRIAERHNFHALLHEKPFAGVNGSGKHCNWSAAVAATNPEIDGVNLLKPGTTPHANLRFMLFLAAVLKGVNKHQGLLRASVAGSGNEHRLGANEAPPAIMSAFVGAALTGMIEEIIEGRSPKNAAQAMLQLGVEKLPEIARDNTDRNRTSPFAFTGNKFEFRAVGSSQSIAFPVTVLNAAVAEAIDELTVALEKEINGKGSVDDAVLRVVRDAFKESSPIRFEGNGYSEEWVKEAAKRGLLNLAGTPDALAQLNTPHAKQLFSSLGVMTEAELESRYHVRLERYVKDILIEAHTLREMVDTFVVPSALTYAGMLAQSAAAASTAGIKTVPHVAEANRIGEMIEQLEQHRTALRQACTKAGGMHDDPEQLAQYLTAEVRDIMLEVRNCCDVLEMALPDESWPLPKYREMLFPV
ncbi:MAG: glutamine synthetase III [Gemmatimonadaceae bacterium]|nr:glutamine synthetase III [Gemmatimonadaceae bacterium]